MSRLNEGTHIMESTIGLQNEGSNAPALLTCMLPTDTTVLGNLCANNHYSAFANLFGLHTPYACHDYAASVLLRTSSAHEHTASSRILPTININLSNIHTWAILDSGATSYVW